MRQILLGCVMLLIFVIGYIVTNEIDFFLKNIQYNSHKSEKNGKFYIAYEHPEDCLVMKEIYEEMKAEILVENLELVYGSICEINRMIKAGNVDIAVCCFHPEQETATEKYKNFKIVSIKKPVIQYQGIAQSISPLSKEDNQRIVLWKEDNRKIENVIARFFRKNAV